MKKGHGGGISTKRQGHTGEAQVSHISVANEVVHVENISRGAGSVLRELRGAQRTRGLKQERIK